MKNQIKKLIDVKSIVTIMFAISYCVMSFLGNVPDSFNSIFNTIIVFYFGTQVGKKIEGTEKE